MSKANEITSNKDLSKLPTKSSPSKPTKKPSNRSRKKTKTTTNTDRLPKHGLIVNAEPWQTRIAHVENSRVVDLFVETASERSIVGNIYKGRVVRVLPGMQAAFVEIGLERTAFLYVAEVHDEYTDSRMIDGEDFDTVDAILEESSKIQPRQIDELLKEGQEIIVQATKAPMGTKGARLTGYVSLPGRNLVLMPQVSKSGVSRRIVDIKERRRLRDIIRRINKLNQGIILRTASEGKSSKDLLEDVTYLQSLWKRIQMQAKNQKAPACIYEEEDLTMRCIRDLVQKDMDEVVIDDEQTLERARVFIEDFMPKRADALKHYSGDKPIFEAYDIDSIIRKSLESKVWLKSGGYLIIEQTEALVAVDVNTGSFTGKTRNFDETVLKTNLEAVAEIVHQLRLRNIGGIIILDLIDMDRAAHRDKVFKALEEALKKDKARTKISRISSLGLVEMTRKRTAENIHQRLSDNCFYCQGSGRLKSKASVSHDIFRTIKREPAKVAGSKVFVTAHPEIIRHLRREEKDYLAGLEKRIEKKIQLQRDDTLHLEQFEVHA